MEMDKVILGDNQFFAVNHLSDERSRQQAVRFKDDKAIINVLDTAMECGVNTFMCTTHDRIANICEHMRQSSGKYSDFKFYPCMPYAHKYANAVTELGYWEHLRLICQAIFYRLFQSLALLTLARTSRH